MAPVNIVCPDKLTIGKGVYINPGFLALTCLALQPDRAGVTIGRYAIIGVASVVTHDVGDYEVAVGNPARVVNKLV